MFDDFCASEQLVSLYVSSPIAEMILLTIFIRQVKQGFDDSIVERVRPSVVEVHARFV